MNTMESPRGEKIETLKDIIENIRAINDEMGSQLQMIADALVHGNYLSGNDRTQNESLTMLDSLRHERDRAEENLKLLVSIREYLW